MHDFLLIVIVQQSSWYAIMIKRNTIYVNFTSVGWLTGSSGMAYSSQPLPLTVTCLYDGVWNVRLVVRELLPAVGTARMLTVCPLHGWSAVNVSEHLDTVSPSELLSRTVRVSGGHEIGTVGLSVTATEGSVSWISSIPSTKWSYNNIYIQHTFCQLHKILCINTSTIHHWNVSFWSCLWCLLTDTHSLKSASLFTASRQFVHSRNQKIDIHIVNTGTLRHSIQGNSNINRRKNKYEITWDQETHRFQAARWITVTMLIVLFMTRYSDVFTYVNFTFSMYDNIRSQGWMNCQLRGSQETVQHVIIGTRNIMTKNCYQHICLIAIISLVYFTPKTAFL